MSNYALIAIIVFDIFLVFGLIILLHKNKKTDLALSDLTAERELISGLQTSMRSDISKTSSEQKVMMQNISKIAAEIEQEITKQQTGFGKNLDEITLELAQEFEKPLMELTMKQNALQALYKDIKKERLEVERVVTKATQILNFFNDKVPYEKILSDIEDKKYIDAKRLLSEGVKTEEIATRLGLPHAQVEIMGSLTSRNL